jgi:hypothetical protein
MIGSSYYRDDPLIGKYKQTVADITAILWGFHKDRVTSGNMEFAYCPALTRHRGEPFDPQRVVESATPPHRIVKKFADGIKESMQASWKQFLDGVGISTKDSAILDMASVPEGARRFFDPYPRSLIDHVIDLGTKVKKQGKDQSILAVSDEVGVREVMSAGIGTGAKMTSQLRALFGEDFSPALAVVISRVGIVSLNELERQIGMKRDGKTESYALLDGSELGLNKEDLMRLGVGAAWGCPAGMRVSTRTRDFLEQRGVQMSGKTVLQDFAKMTSDKFDHYLGDWYKRLSLDERQQYLDSESRKVLDGSARRDAIELRNVRWCPYGSKERS